MIAKKIFLCALVPAVILSLTLLLCSCAEGRTDSTKVDTTPNESTVQEIPFPGDDAIDINISDDSDLNYTIVVDEDSSDNVVLSARELAVSLGKATGVYVTVSYEDAEHAVYLTILEERAAEFGSYGYGIYTAGDDLYIWGTCDGALMLALSEFDRTFVDAAQQDDVTVPAKTCIEYSRDEAPTLAEIFDMDLNAVNVELINEVKFGKYKVYDGNYRIAQGAATDGKYIYFVIKHSEYSGIILKYDYNGNRIAMSEPFDFGHANDITFDTHRNIVVVVHGSSDVNTANGNGKGRRLSFLDGDTLALVHTDPAILADGKGAGAISFDTETGVYTIGQGGKYIRRFTLDDNFKVTYLSNKSRADKSVEGSKGYIVQGMGGDDKYLYFPNSNSTSGDAFDNILVVYDEDANYVGTLHIDTTMESESMFYNDGKYYLFFNHDGARVYELAYEPMYFSTGVEFYTVDETITVDRGSSGFVYRAPTKISERYESCVDGTAYHAVAYSKNRMWYMVELENGTYAYILANCVMANNGEPVTYVQYKMKVTADSLNVRRQPNANSEIVGNLKKDEVVYVTGTIEGSAWVRINYGGYKYFVSSDYLIGD